MNFEFLGGRGGKVFKVIKVIKVIRVIKVVKVIRVFNDEGGGGEGNKFFWWEGGGGIFGWFGEQMDILVCFFYECGLIFLRPTCDIYVSKIY